MRQEIAPSHYRLGLLLPRYRGEMARKGREITSKDGSCRWFFCYSKSHEINMCSYSSAGHFGVLFHAFFWDMAGHGHVSIVSLCPNQTYRGAISMAISKESQLQPNPQVLYLYIHEWVISRNHPKSRCWLDPTIFPCFKWILEPPFRSSRLYIPWCPRFPIKPIKVINGITLWWTNIAMENGHRNSGFSH